MKLVVSQLKEGENAFKFSSAKDGWVKDLIHRIERKGYVVAGNLSVDVNLTKLEPDYYLRGQLVFSVNQNCARCAEAFALPIQHPFNVALAHVSHANVKSAGLVEEESEELDVNFFEGNDIDLSPIVEEQFFLSIPYQALCDENCAGICQTCGSNLNQGHCSCKVINPVSPFSALRDFRI